MENQGNYFIREKRAVDEIAIVYYLEYFVNGYYVYLINGENNMRSKILLSFGINENKRGWSFDTYLFTPIGIHVSLPRGSFEKIELDKVNFTLQN